MQVSLGVAVGGHEFGVLAAACVWFPRPNVLEEQLILNRIADVVVIGTGAFGASVAYHLAAEGAGRVVLLDRAELASQTSPRAAGLTQQIRPEPEMTRLAMRSVEKIQRFSDETGEPLAYVQSGSVKMARTEADAWQIRSEIEAGPNFGLKIHAITSEELDDLAPFARAHGVLAMWCTPSDLHTEPAQIPLGYARAARRLGTEVMLNTPVVAINLASGSVSGVVTSDGVIEAPIVVDAAGAWTRLVGEQLGLRIPVVSMRHQLMITEPIAGVLPHHAICRVIDANVYVRPEQGGLMLGGYERDPMPYRMDALPASFQIHDLPLDGAVLDRLAASVRGQFPVFAQVGRRALRGGLPTMTADGLPIVGPIPAAAGLFVASGCCVGGLTVSPAIGELLAREILSGRPEPLLAGLRMNRFGSEVADDNDLQRACIEMYANHYAGMPQIERKPASGISRS